MASPHRSDVLLTLGGLALGAVLGWVSGLLRTRPHGAGGAGGV